MNNLSAILIFGLVSYAVCQPGAPVEVGKQDKIIKRMAEFAVGEIGSEYTLVKIVSATRQVVNGMLYNINLVTRRNIHGQNNKQRACNVLVYEIMHEGYFELEEFHCYFTHKQPQLQSPSP